MYDGQGIMTRADGSVDTGIWENNKLVKRNKIQTQIDKKEPKSKTTSSTTITKKKIKKPKEKKTVFPEVSPKLKLIEDMYKSGALTKDEYEAAKKRATK
jgi:hypothetical protein